MTVTLAPGELPLATIEHIYWSGESARLDPFLNAAIERGASRIAAIAGGEAPSILPGLETGA
ncbi:hypothetical protein [Methylobacterium brachiatum]|jgi:histidine ammonia-lyase|uniref:hypothetical protein n=1 Tax=Methylobacterium brachiatum TaxID=269660 RepID=UPI0024485571|nr:hypothetical protein [Methylobacterium brachiatum]MDH2312379.1 hypothetical protein [Methylobacterium brachiatum]